MADGISQLPEKKGSIPAHIRRRQPVLHGSSFNAFPENTAILLGEADNSREATYQLVGLVPPGNSRERRQYDGKKWDE